MTLTVKIHNPQFPDGQVIGVYPFGQLENNGEAIDISEEAEQQFVTENGVGVEEAFANDATVTIGGSATATVPEPPQPVEESQPQPQEEGTTPAFLQKKEEGGEG
jgi:hypothetical protein